MDELENTGTEENTGLDDAGQVEDAGNSEGTASDKQSGSQDAAGQEDAVAGLKAAATAERQKRQQIETEAAVLREQLDRVSTAKPNQPTQADLFKAMGIEVEDDDDYLTAGQMKKVLTGLVGQITQAMTAQQTQSQLPDFKEIVGIQVGNTFQYAPPLKRALDNNPALAQILQSSPNAALLAYEIAKNDPEYLASKNQKGKSAEQIAAEKAEAKIAAANKKVSISAAKGGGQLDSIAAVKAMSDEELRAHNEKIMSQAL